jgi:hypothetical protein
MQGPWAISLVYGGATHNFIVIVWVARRALQIEEFEGFQFAIEDCHTMGCLDRVLY